MNPPLAPTRRKRPEERSGGGRLALRRRTVGRVAQVVLQDTQHVGQE